jgi:hypothetical protein
MTNWIVRRLMFYVYVIIGFGIFVAGLILTTGWWKLVWVIGSVVVVMFLPSMLAVVLDPLNTKRIHSYCADIGVTHVEVKPFPNHYGVHFKKNGRKYYAKCEVVRGKIKWKGSSPAEIQ